MRLLACVALVVAAAGCGDETVSPPKAAAPSATEAARRKPDRTPPVMPVDEALARVDRYIDVPVGLPAGLPESTRAFRKMYLSKRGGVRTAQLSLRLPGRRRILTLIAGAAGFDGCGPTDPEVVDVNGEPGLLTTSDSSGDVYSTVVWPATMPDAEGTYNLSGPFSAKRILALARSVRLPGKGGAAPTGC